MREPEVVDLELTTDTLKASVRDAQRIVAELRTDLETRRMELAEAQVARAQLEGRVREAERRVIEARQVIELQREELAATRMELRDHHGIGGSGFDDAATREAERNDAGAKSFARRDKNSSLLLDG